MRALLWPMLLGVVSAAPPAGVEKSATKLTEQKPADSAAAPLDPTRVLPAGALPLDGRLGKPRGTHDPFHPWIPPRSLGEWEKRAKQVRTQLLVSTGLWPLPDRTPMEPVVHGKVDKGDYTVEKVYLQSYPGHYVTGNLYRPKGRQGKLPAVLSPHGHWVKGRFHDAGEKDAAKQIEAGAEQYTLNARFLLQARMATLARLGCVVFHYDMVGYADSNDYLHGMGFTDVAAVLHGQSFMGLQTWNSIRALDFLASLPDVDPKRIGVSGASGGGTQTFMLCAIDDRPAVAFPAVMASTGMQGGCVCENCPNLRVGTGNVEFAALFAPRPLGMSAANDWTREIETKGLPELRLLYSLYRLPDNVMAKAYLQFGHNYNQVSRELMYEWMNRWLRLNAESLQERPIDPIPIKNLSVFDEKHPKPSNAKKPAELRTYLTETAAATWNGLRPTDEKSRRRFVETVGPALEAMLVDRLPDAETVEVKDVGPIELGGFTVDRLLLGRREAKTLFPVESIPAVVFHPKKWNGRMVVWPHAGGHAALVDAKKKEPIAPLRRLLDHGMAVLAPDVFLTGEFHAADKPTPFPEIDKVYSGYTFGFNRSVLANRVHDVLTAIACARDLYGADSIDLIGFGESGPWAVLTKAAAGDAVRRLAADFNNFSFAAVRTPMDPMVLPSSVKFGDLAGLAMLCAPGEMFARGMDQYRYQQVQDLEHAYALSGNPGGLTTPLPGRDSLDDAIAWLLRDAPTK